MLKSEITGETFVNAFDNQYGKRYSITLSKKNADGNWENGYISAQFKKDVVLNSGTKINVKNGWLTFYKNKDNKYVPYVFINDFEVLENARQQLEQMCTVVEDTGLPF